MNKRVWTILMPFLIAAWFLPLFYIVIENIPVAAIFMNGGGFTEQFTWKNWKNIVEAVYIEAPYSPSPWGISSLVYAGFDYYNNYKSFAFLSSKLYFLIS